jgi:hypothetical protein
MLVATVKHMPGDRSAGYYYIEIECEALDDKLTLMEDGHPDFPKRWWDNEPNSKEKAEIYAQMINDKMAEKTPRKSSIRRHPGLVSSYMKSVSVGWSS